MALSVREIAEGNDISYEKLLGGLAREEMVARLANSLFGKYLWFCEPENLGISSYIQNVDRVLNFGYMEDNRAKVDGTPGARLNDKLKGAIILAIAGVSPKGSERIEGKPGADKDIYFDVYIEGMRTPLRVNIFPVNSPNLHPAKREFRLLRTNEIISYFHYPVEAVIAKDIFTILSSLDLIYDMEAYDRVYKGITSIPLEGKLVWSELNELLKPGFALSNPGITEYLESFKDDRNMYKKWNKYIKRHNYLSSDWKRTINALKIFIDPIWDALREDRPFLGDWVPELGRFL